MSNKLAHAAPFSTSAAHYEFLRSGRATLGTWACPHQPEPFASINPALHMNARGRKGVCVAPLSLTYVLRCPVLLELPRDPAGTRQSLGEAHKAPVRKMVRL